MIWLLACTNEPDSAGVFGVSLVDPGALVRDEVSFVAQVQASGTVGLTWTLDGSVAGHSRDEPWELPVDTTKLEDGNHFLAVSLTEFGGRGATADLEFWVDNHGAGQPVEWVFPNPDGAFCGPFPMQAWSNSALTLGIDGGALFVADGHAAILELDPSRYPSGPHTLTASVSLGYKARYQAQLPVRFEENTCGSTPSAWLESPPHETPVDGTALFTAGVSDDVGVVALDWEIDGVPAGVSNVAPFSLSVDTAPFAEGAHRVTLSPTDTDENSSAFEGEFFVDRTPPVVSLSIEPDLDPLSGPFTLSAEVYEETTLSDAWLELDGEALGTVASGTSEFALDTQTLGRGTHTFTLVAVDSAGHEATAELMRSVDNPPSVHILHPDPGVQPTDSLQHAGWAEDDGGTPELAWMLDGAGVGFGNLVVLDSCALEPGNHLISATATDDLGAFASETRPIVLKRGLAVSLADVPSELSKTTHLQAWSESDWPISAMVWTVDGTLVATARPSEAPATPCPLRCADSCAAWTALPDLSAVSTGAHTLTLTATSRDGTTTRADTPVFFDRDADADGFDDSAYGGDDLDDADSAINPAATEICDGLDNNCDGTVDERFDNDGDGYFDSVACDFGDDCDDGNAMINPANTEVCDGVDNDCDGGTDLGAPSVAATLFLTDPLYTYTPSVEVIANLFTVNRDTRIHAFSLYLDPAGGSVTMPFVVWGVQGRGSHWLAEDWVELASVDVVVAGVEGWFASGPLDLRLEGSDFSGGYAPWDYVAVGIRTPGGVDVFHGDVDSSIRVAGGLEMYGFAMGEVDSEFGTLQTLPNYAFAQSVELGPAPSGDNDADSDGYTEFCGDCDDLRAERSPGASEACNGYDDNCDGTSDEGWDNDNDGWGDCLDCDDADAAASPGLPEVCDDSHDEDCDGYTPRCQASGAYDVGSVSSGADGDGGRDGLGSAVTFGDFDGDGTVDLAGGAPGVDTAATSAGRVALWKGPLSTAGLGSPSAQFEGASAYMAYGSVLASGDVDNDGLDELLVGVPADPGSGAEAGGFAIRGGDLADPLGVTTAYAVGKAEGDHFGTSVAILPNLHKTRTAFAVGAPGDDTTCADCGSVYVFDAGKTGDLTTSDAGYRLKSSSTGAQFGAAISAGDLDGDGGSELAVGAPGIGRAYIFETLTSGSGSSARNTIVGDAADAFGAALAVVGDVDADGYEDLAVAAPDGNGLAGALYLIEADRVGESATSVPRRIGTDPGDHAGTTVARAGDVDGDGFADVVVGAPEAGRDDAGAAWIVWGPWMGARTMDENTLRINGLAAGDFFGGSAATGSDCTGDGYDDLAFGAPAADSTAWDAGSIWLFTEIP